MSERTPVVFVHVHYPEIWAEMAERIAESFDRPFGLVLTCRDAGLTLAEPQTPHLAFVERITTPNRGRDVLPFMTALREMDDRFDIGLKLHTKRSVHRDDGEDWRRFLVDSLLAQAPPGGPLQALTLMENEPRIGLLAPIAHLLPLRSRLVMNRRVTRLFAETLGYAIDLDELETGRFAAGSMFWFRREALARFAEPRLVPLFADEKGQLDGTAAHAAERLFAHAARRESFLATAMEAAGTLNVGALQERTLPELEALSEDALARSHNPFILPLARFWLRFPNALIAAHYAYRALPKPLWRLARRAARAALPGIQREQSDR